MTSEPPLIQARFGITDKQSAWIEIRTVKTGNSRSAVLRDILQHRIDLEEMEAQFRKENRTDSHD